jgi:putative transcriptional regulator
VMSEERTTRVELDSNGTVWELLPNGSRRVAVDRTDRARLAAMTEEEINANALADPDNPPLTPEEIQELRPVPNPRRIRDRLGLTQVEFARTFEIPLGTLRDWEQSVSEPDMAAKTLLRVIEQDPDAVRHALRKASSPLSHAIHE